MKKEIEFLQEEEKVVAKNLCNYGFEANFNYFYLYEGKLVNLQEHKDLAFVVANGLKLYKKAVGINIDKEKCITVEFGVVSSKYAATKILECGHKYTAIKEDLYLMQINNFEDFTFALAEGYEFLTQSKKVC